MKITAIKTTRIHIPSNGDYRMARGAHDALRSLIVRLYTDEGIIGVGESHQGVAGYTHETVGTMDSVITQVYAPELVGCELGAPEALVRRMAEARRGNLFARCAVEMALWDALGQATRQPVVSLLGGPVRDELQLSASIGIDKPDAMAEKALRYVRAGYRTIKIKVGSSELKADLQRVREIRRAIGDEVAIRLDANEGYSPDQALVFVRGLDGLNIEHLEQPVSAERVDAMAALTRLGIVPILADESVHTPEDAHRLVAMQGAHAIKLKLTKVGGYIAARKIIDIAEAAGLKVVIGQGICSSIEAAAEAQLACAYPHIHVVAEMVGPTKLLGDLTEQPLDLSAGRLTLPRAHGIGVRLSESLLQRYTAAPEDAKAS